MRILEHLRNGIKHRLQRGDYEDGDDDARIDPRLEKPLYPTLPRIG